MLLSVSIFSVISLQTVKDHSETTRYVRDSYISATQCSRPLMENQCFISRRWQQISFSPGESSRALGTFIISFHALSLSLFNEFIGSACRPAQKKREEKKKRRREGWARRSPSSCSTLCFEGYLDNKATLAPSPAARLKDASLSLRELVSLNDRMYKQSRQTHFILDLC